MVSSMERISAEVRMLNASADAEDRAAILKKLTELEIAGRPWGGHGAAIELKQKLHLRFPGNEV